LNTLLIGSDLDDRVHAVKVELGADLPDKAGILSKRNEKMVQLERFSGGAFYPGALLLVGDLDK